MKKVRGTQVCNQSNLGRGHPKFGEHKAGVKTWKPGNPDTKNINTEKNTKQTITKTDRMLYREVNRIHDLRNANKAEDLPLNIGQNRT